MEFNLNNYEIPQLYRKKVYHLRQRVRSKSWQALNESLIPHPNWSQAPTKNETNVHKKWFKVFISIINVISSTLQGLKN